MPQDKRLIVTKAVVHKIQRLRGGNEAVAAADGVFIEFCVPSVVVSQCPDILGGHVFQLPNRAYPADGKSTCLIVPRVISVDAFKINKRHGYYDAVVTAEAICKRNDPESVRRALQVAKTFSHFVVDARIVSKLPPCILTATSTTTMRTTTAASQLPCSSKGVDRKGKKNGTSHNSLNGGGATNPTETPAAAQGGASPSRKAPRKLITALHGLDDRINLTFRLSQGAKGAVVHSHHPGQLMLRVGHGGMKAGDVCDNAKCFVFALKRDFPSFWKYIHEFHMTSDVTEPIRFMEVQIKK